VNVEDRKPFLSPYGSVLKQASVRTPRQDVGEGKKGKFYGALKHKCGTPNGEVSCGYVSKASAIEHKFRIDDRDSVEGKKLQKETGWSRTDFVWVPEDTTIRPTRSDVATKRGREHVSDINTDQETEHVSKKQVLSVTCGHVVIHSMLPSLLITTTLLAVLSCITLYCG